MRTWRLLQAARNSCLLGTLLLRVASSIMSTTPERRATQADPTTPRTRPHDEQNRTRSRIELADKLAGDFERISTDHMLAQRALFAECATAIEEQKKEILELKEKVRELERAQATAIPQPVNINVPPIGLQTLRGRLGDVRILRAQHATVATARDFDETNPNAPLVGPYGLIMVLKEIRSKLHAAIRVFDNACARQDLKITHYPGTSSYYVPAGVGDECHREKSNALKELDELLAPA